MTCCEQVDRAWRQAERVTLARRTLKGPFATANHVITNAVDGAVGQLTHSRLLNGVIATQLTLLPL